MWTPILKIATSLLGTVAAEERYVGILQGIRSIIPCDSCALLRMVGDTLVVVASEGLVPEAAGLRFNPAEHPRLAQFLRARRPQRIVDTALPDPFDGLVACDAPLGRVHACMGCALVVDEQIVGVLAVDAIDPNAFDDISEDQVAAVAAFAAAGIRGADLIERLEREAVRAERVAKDLVRDTATRAGGELIGQSSAMTGVKHEVEIAALSSLTVLVTGETGVGKEVVAHAIHAASERAEQPLIYVNCAALPESIAESELFGHVKGAFTGATENRAGKFEVADGGTLFLDEIGELPLAVQPKLLRALQSGEIQRVGSDKLLKVDVRIVAATNRDLPAEVTLGRFRADLYHRLTVYPLRIPPLRERRDDISLLAGYFLDEARMRLGLGRIRLSSLARVALETFDWPGNVRELEHTLLRAALRASGGRRRELVVIDVEHLDLPASIAPAMPAPPELAASVIPVLTLHDAVEGTKRRCIATALDDAQGNWAEAARRLGLDRSNLHRLAKKLGVAKHA